jgi:hypothetical protein
MQRLRAVRLGVLAGIWLGCAGGAGDSEGESQPTTYDLNGTYAFTLTPGSLIGGGAGACDPTQAGTGSVGITWTLGTSQSELVLTGSSGTVTVPAGVNGNTVSYSEVESNHPGCDSYEESGSFELVTADTGTGTIAWSCSSVQGGSAESCAEINTITFARE